MIRKTNFLYLVLIVAVVLIWAPNSYAEHGPGSVQEMVDVNNDSDTVQSIPVKMSLEQVNYILFGMANDRDRKNPSAEMRKEAAETTPKVLQYSGLSALSKAFRSGMAHTYERFSTFFSVAAVAQVEVPKVFQDILGSNLNMTPGEHGLALVLLTFVWGGGMFGYRKMTAGLQAKISQIPQYALWHTKVGRLLFRSCIDLVGLVFISFAVSAIYLLIFHDGSSGRPVLVSWWLSMATLEIISLVSSFLLAPAAPSLRIFNLNTDTARYVHRWNFRIAVVISVSVLMGSLLRLDHKSETIYLLVSSFAGFVVIAIISTLLFINRVNIMAFMLARTRAESMGRQLAGFWHVGVQIYFWSFWIFWELTLVVLGDDAMLPGFMTLLALPFYFIADMGIRKLVAFVAEIVVSSDEADEMDANYISRFQSFLISSFRVLLFCGTVFSLIDVWGFHFDLGERVVGAAFESISALIMAYVSWVFVSRFFERKIAEKRKDDEHSYEGDRFSTLLQLVKTFLFATIFIVTILIVLAALGVNIGSLIAGASVFGIAIGFGSQTLVKDIISGIFFLMDDAFRVGDYIETAGAKGTVEAISVRSIKLRHHRGFLYTIPFGAMEVVRNNTRDWAIMKLQYLVPFDTNVKEIKKIIKQINKSIRADEEFNEMLLDDIKCQGVMAMEEYGMRMRLKFMTRPGSQFTIRKHVLAMLREKFAEAGIEFARPRVSVQIPDGGELSDEERTAISAAALNDADKRMKEKTAVAAVPAVP
ncbi:mechanosensitive ion channel family protein [Maridesulfovibrio salexigens]|uniref:MscS Mechanosensitive ion channel n=1 Tax=Maridesulfovibrio salexigens (strain ATCC 14822 / DSM 2638 / NCIMB 8403 / VKM B-1763) TaxID=526222 RepID=C6BTA2_MARSD|nr:mechanosensitive ion channel domain-containing protein [Maridesulfovibrio salexigens]ACS81583.1 MscS Mechanosensitive ion channel [Maridesulfovibrio salexigens DSM 2638]